MADLTLSPDMAATEAIQYTPGLSLIQAAASGTQLIIGGVSYGLWKAETFRREENLGSTYSASVQMRYTGGSKPTKNQSAAVFIDSVKRFGGYVKTIGETAVPSQPFESILTIELEGYGARLDRIVVAMLYNAATGALVRTIVYDLWYRYLRPLGITYTSGADPGVLIAPILFHYDTLRVAFQKLLDQAPGWSLWIDSGGDLKLADTNGVGDAAPFELSRTGVNPALWEQTKSADTITVRESNEQFRNREYVVPSSDLVGQHTETFTGDGVKSQFFTVYPLTSDPVVTVDGVSQRIDLITNPSGGEVYYRPGTTEFSFHSVIGPSGNTAPPPGAVIVITYVAPWQLACVAQDDASIADVGPFEHVTQAQNVTDVDSGNALAQARLDLYGPAGVLPKSITYAYNSGQQAAWLEPGMLQTVNWTFPDVSGVYTVRSVSTEEQGQASFWRHTVVLGLGPTDVTGVSDAQALIQSALRRTNVKTPTLATLEIAINGLDLSTDPADLKNTYRFLGSGVIASWDARMLPFPPAGSDVIVDLLKNGVSIFRASSPFSQSDVIVIPDGSTAEQSGFRFVSDNLAYADGDVLTAVIIQVGSSTPGKFLLVHLNLKPSLAVAG